MIHITCVHTGASPKIIGLLEDELQKRMTVPYVVSHHTCPTIISEVSSVGYVTERAAGDLLRAYTLCLDIRKNM